MSDGFGAFVRKEMTEIVRTWRLFVLPGMALFFALTGPLTARYTEQLLRVAGGPQIAAIIAAMPAPTFFDAYGQWIKNLTQVVLIALIVIYGGIVSSERTSGTAVLVLTKPVSRQAFVAAKAFVHMLFIAAIVVVGTLITWGVTALVFGKAAPGPLWQAALSWLVLAWFFIGLMTLFSVLFGSQAGAAGAGIAAFAALSIASISPAAVLFTPAGLVVTPAAVAAGAAFPSAWPVVGSIVGTALLVALAASVFAGQEL
ncbi:MAG: ABC transporter permease subunit [Coriobacteriia bacterium]|nr:ABC transporter permease subunit [Coriobacteriia bacterium]